MDIKFNYRTNSSGLTERLKPLFNTVTNLKFLWSQTLSKNPFPSFSKDSGFETTSSEQNKSAERTKKLNLCLQQMNPKQKTVFVLKTFEDLSTKDICNRLDISENDFWKYIGNARKEISEKLFVN